MRYRYDKIIFEKEEGLPFEVQEIAKKGISFEISDETKNGVLIIKARAIVEDNYANPPIPKGYKHTEGEWYDGFVIQRISDGSEFVWIPVGYLDANGTLDGKHYDEKFGRRNYCKDRFSFLEGSYNEEMTYSELEAFYKKATYYEIMTDELRDQIESVNKHGGFYISRYNISINKKTNNIYEAQLQSKKGVEPLLRCNFKGACTMARNFENSENVKSHLVFGCEYDSVLEWFIKSKARTLHEIVKNSTNWGNYENTKKSPCKLVETGFNQEWSTNRIYDFAGNVNEMTQERFWEDQYVIRGGSYYDYGNVETVVERNEEYLQYGVSTAGFRVSLFIR